MKITCRKCNQVKEDRGPHFKKAEREKELNLLPTWRELHQNNIKGLQMMIDDKHWQSSEAKVLLAKAKAEYDRLEKAVQS